MDQDLKFLRRRRLESPDLAFQKILGDSFLKFVYSRSLQVALIDSNKTDKLIELGSAGGITKHLMPSVRTYDVRPSCGVDHVLPINLLLPFEDHSIDRVIAKDVLHHISNPYTHFSEIQRILKPGSRVIYIEPNWNIFSKFIFYFLHPEPFNVKQENWDFPSNDPMYSNQALASIIFVRDSELFKLKFPSLDFQISSIPINGLAYLISGGVYGRNRISSRFLKRLYKIEERLPFWMKVFGLNRVITVYKKSRPL
jgi:SAM-dependent methyltransferase